MIAIYVPRGIWVAVLSASAPFPALADQGSGPETQPNEITVYGRALEQIGEATSGSEGVVGYEDFEDRPLSRVGELTENVPGMVATQHSGGGKANQYFLRGFNLDHGTDFAGFIDGVPINMRSHGHGQGYLDLNFIIPELVERIAYTKGPYHAELGDFSSAGSANFLTKSRIDAPFAEITAGSFGYKRVVVAASKPMGPGDLLAGFESALSDGPWVLHENLRKLNGLLKYSANGWSVSLSGNTSRWTSTDQVPRRAIDAGLIDRKGFIDPDLGGRSSRVAFSFNGRLGATDVSAYAIGSRLRLTSNFTYFLDDPLNGDEFLQTDRRGVFGGAIGHEAIIALGATPITLRMGGDLRFDRAGQVGLYRTSDDTILSTVREDGVRELGGGIHAELEASLTRSVRIVLGARGDAIAYWVDSKLAPNSGHGWNAILTPKTAVAWQVADGIELYANYGQGYHSNDVRGATIVINPATGETADPVPVFSRSHGYELGARIERGNLSASLVAFRLDLESELVFVGDAGTTEASPASRRYGGEATFFWKPNGRLTVDGAWAFTRARFRGTPAGEDHVPGAVSSVLAAGISGQPAPGLTVTARLRHFGRASLVEDASVRSRATTLITAGAYWEWRRLRFSAELLNLFDAKDADVTYFYASRLPGEPAGGVEDVHLHPVEPRQLRLGARLSF